MKFELVKSTKNWEEILNNFPHASFLQSSAYWKLLEKQGSTVFPILLRDSKNSLLSICLAYIVKAKRGVILAVSQGPLFLDEGFNSAIFKHWDAYLTTLARQQKCDVIRIAPCWNDEINITAPVMWKPSPTHLHAENTLVIDLTLSDTELFSQMRKSTRQLTKRSLRLVDNNTLTVEWKDCITKDMQDVYTATMKRGRFVGSSLESIQKEYDTFNSGGDNSDAYIVAVYNKKNLLSWGMFIRYRDKAYYRHGANILHKEFPAAHLVYWKLFHKAQQEGCISYDLWGISPKEKPRHPWSAISLFKTGFGGKKKKYAHAIDKPISWKYIFLRLIETVRSKVRGYTY